jgi:hypothetical protein
VTDTREFKPSQDNEKQFFSRKVEESLKKRGGRARWKEKEMERF